jgi:tRNA 2-thiouridine synthesizing protein A
MSESAPHTIVDSRGSSCPGPILDLALAYRRSKVGDVIELWATDPGVKSDVQAWAAKTKNEIVSIEDQKDKIVAVLRIKRR